MICLSVNENEEHLLMLLIVRCPQSVSKSLCYRWVRRLKGGISLIHFAIERKKERIQELSVHFRQTLEVRWWSQLSFERREEMRQKRCGVKVFAVQILKGPTDLWDKINGDQTLLNFSFNVTPQDDSSEKNSVDWWLWLLHKHIHINTHSTHQSFSFPYIYLCPHARTHPGTLRVIESLSTCLLWYVKLIFRGWAHKASQNQHTLYVPGSSFQQSTMPHSSSLRFPKAVSDSITCLSVWKSFPFLLFQVFSFFQKLSPVARCLLEVEKFFSSPKFLPSSLFNWQDEYRRDKA